MFVIGTFFAMLVIIGFNEGWGKFLKIFGSYILSAIILGVLAETFNLTSDIINVLGIMLMGGFTVGLLLYCFMRGYITKL